MKKKKTRKRKWSRHVTETSNAMDLKKNIFAQDDPAAIAKSLKQSSRKSHRRKTTPFRSAMSMLNFYINRAGHHLPAKQKKVLEEAKDKLREEFGREAGKQK